MNKNTTGLSGRIVRAMKRELDPKAFTRAQAVRLIACTTDSALIEAFKGHQNKHVRRYCGHKLGLLAMATVEASVVKVELTTIPPTVQAEIKVSEERYLADLAAQYGETVDFVSALVTEKGGDLSAAKRSLISRKSARTRAAKASATAS